MVSLLWHGRLSADDVEGTIKSRSPVRKRGFVALLTTGKSVPINILLVS